MRSDVLPVRAGQPTLMVASPPFDAHGDAVDLQLVLAQSHRGGRHVLRLRGVAHFRHRPRRPFRIALRRPAAGSLRPLVVRLLVGHAALALAGDQPVRDPLRVDCRRPDLPRVVLQRRDPRADVGGAVARLVADAELLAGHHRGDLRPQLLAGVGVGAEAAVVHQGGPVQPVRVPGGVPQLVQRGVRVGVLRRELAPVRQHHVVVLEAVVGAVAGHVVDPDAAGLDQRLGPLVSLPRRRRDLKRAQLQALGLLDVEDVVELDQRPVPLHPLDLRPGHVLDLSIEEFEHEYRLRRHGVCLQAVGRSALVDRRTGSLRAEPDCQVHGRTA